MSDKTLVLKPLPAIETFKELGETMVFEYGDGVFMKVRVPEGRQPGWNAVHILGSDDYGVGELTKFSDSACVAYLASFRMESPEA